MQSLDIKSFRAPKGFEDADATSEGGERKAVAPLVTQSDGLQEGVGKEVDTFIVSLTDDAGEGRGIGGDEGRPRTGFHLSFFAEKAICRGRESNGDALFLQFPGEIAGEKQRRVRQVALYLIPFAPGGNDAVEESLVGERGSHDVAAIRAHRRGAEVVVEFSNRALRRGPDDADRAPCRAEREAVEVVEDRNPVAPSPVVAAQILVNPLGRDALGVENPFVGDDSPLDPADTRAADGIHPFSKEISRLREMRGTERRVATTYNIQVTVQRTVRDMPVVGESRRKPIITAKEFEGSRRRNEFQDRGRGDLQRFLVRAKRLAGGKVADSARQSTPLHAR